MNGPSIQFLTVARLLEIHSRVLHDFGGAGGVRDAGLLDSAVAMPAAMFGGEFLHEGIPAMAAAYLFHICKNHPFADGNKRAALGSAIQFLYLNEFSLTATPDSVEQLTFGVADGSIRKEGVTAFFEQHARPTQPEPPGRQRKRGKPKPS